VTTFLVLLAAYTLSQFYRSFLAIVAGELTRTLGLDAADLGSVSAIWFAAFALAQFPVGWSLDRLGPRRTLAGFMAMAVLGAAWFARAGSLADCLVAMALIGIGCSPVLMASLYVFGRTYPPERFAMLASLVIGLGSVGNLLGATPDLVYGHLHLAFGAVLLAAGAVYAFAPARPAEAGRRTPPP
jgi:MFS family permease